MDAFLVALGVLVGLIAIWFVYSWLRVKIIFTYGTPKQRHAYLVNILQENFRNGTRPPDAVIAYFVEPCTREWASEVGVNYPDRLEQAIVELDVVRLMRGQVCLEEPYKSMFLKL